MKNAPRLDRHLQALLPDLTRSRIKRLIDQGHIKVNGRIVKAGTPIKAGDQVDVDRPPPEPSRLVPEEIPLDIIYEDDDLIAINKEAGMVVHPAAGHAGGTLMNAVLAHLQAFSEKHHPRGPVSDGAHTPFVFASGRIRPIAATLLGPGVFQRPGIVHRLDKGTSGVIVIAKNEPAYRSLARQFKDRSVEKIYLALVWGRPAQKEGTLSSFLGRHPRHRQKISEIGAKGRWSVTDWKIREAFSGLTLLEVHPRTGRTHQIRVHLSGQGHPVVGDPVYGGKRRPGKKTPEGVKERIDRLDHQALHAWRLTFRHPALGQPMTFTAPVPADMQRLIDGLRREA